MRKHFVFGGKGGEAWLICPKHDDMFMQATGSLGFSTDEDCIGCLAAEQAWDEGFSAGWDECDNPGGFVNDKWDAKTPNPYRQGENK